MHAFEGPRSIWIKLRELRRSKQIDCIRGKEIKSHTLTPVK